METVILPGIGHGNIPEIFSNPPILEFVFQKTFPLDKR
jgi:hypothetical protein